MLCYEELGCPPECREKCAVFKLSRCHECWTVDEAFGGCDGKTLEGCVTCKVYIKARQQ